MTLMELVIGLVITSLMATAGAATFSTLIDHRRTIRQATKDVERAAALRETLRSWLIAGTVQIQRGGLPGRGSTATSVPMSRSTSSSGASQHSRTASPARPRRRAVS
jgi:Tfp pilus assembly protein FimT